MQEGKSQAFSIVAEFTNCGSDGSVTCINYLKITVHKTTIQLRQKQVFIDGDIMTLPYYSKEFNIFRASSVYVVFESVGFRVLWDGLMGVEVVLEADYKYEVRQLEEQFLATGVGLVVWSLSFTFMDPNLNPISN